MQKHNYSPIHAHKFALAAGISIAFWFIVDVFLAFMWPEQYLAVVPPMLHLNSLNFLKSYFQVTPFGAVYGTIQWFLYTYLYVYLYVVIYNKLIAK